MDGAPLVCAICGVAGSAHEFSTISGTKGSEGINRASGLEMIQLVLLLDSMYTLIVVEITAGTDT